MDNSCEEIVRQEGVGWLFEKTVPRKGSLFFDALGVREEGLQDIHVYRSNGLSSIVVPNSDSFSQIGSGSVSIGVFVNLPTGSDTGVTHHIFDVSRKLRLYELNGVLYFRVWKEDMSYETVSTGESGINFCNNKTYYVKAYRNAHDEQNKIGLYVYGHGTYEKGVESGINLSFNTDLVIGARDDDNSYGYHLDVNSYLSGFYIARDILTQSNDSDYWLSGIPLVGSSLFLKLDENKSNVVLDCSGYGNHAVIDSFDDSCRAVHTNFFSWQNVYGYSTGIDPAFLVPSLMISTEKDVYGDPLGYSGRVKLPVRIEDITCFRANGVCWGRMINPQRLHLRPGQDEFCIQGIFELSELSEGTLLAVGDRYRLDIVNTGFLRVHLGGQITDIELGYGLANVLLNIGKTGCDVWVNGSIVNTISVGSVYSSGGNADFLGVNGGSVLYECDVTFIGVRPALFDEESINNWFTYVHLEGSYSVAYYFYSNTEWVFDLSGYVNHLELLDYDVSVWTGKQSVMPLLVEGFTEVYPDRENLLNPVVIPFNLNGEKITWNVYGSGQVEIEYHENGGLPVFDAYVNFNPYNKVLGFWSQFWNKSNIEYWVNLDGRFYTEDVFRWNIQELNMDYLLQSLNPESYNFCFVGSITGDFGFTVEVIDLILFNIENNIIYKPIPL